MGKYIKIGIIMFIAFVIIIASSAISVTFAGSWEPKAASKVYKSGVKTCKQIERDHENMKGQHEIMFKAWQAKSTPLLS